MKLPGSQHLNTLWQAVNVATEIREFTRKRQTFVFNTQNAITFFLRAEKADVRVVRWRIPRVEVTVRLEGSFGWRIATDQDESGVYVVAHRRRVVGEFSSALFQVVVPEDAHLMLKLDNGRVTLDHVNGTLNIAPPDAAPAPYLLPSGE